jgi:hypothetical protein
MSESQVSPIVAFFVLIIFGTYIILTVHYIHVDLESEKFTFESMWERWWRKRHECG